MVGAVRTEPRAGAYGGLITELVVPVMLPPLSAPGPLDEPCADRRQPGSKPVRAYARQAATSCDSSSTALHRSRTS